MESVSSNIETRVLGDINNGLVSVIIPIYNTGKYLNRCVKSILAQTYKNLEIILVNDGSYDTSYAFCNELVKEHCEQIRCFNMEHRGQGTARNVGLDNANGKYILFVDADDSIHKNMLLEMVEEILRTASDICICDVKLFLSDNESIIQHSLNWGEWTQENYLRNGLNLCSPCNKLFRKEVWANVRFSDIDYEDMEVIPTIISYAKKISFVKKHFYEYRLRMDSITGNSHGFPIKDFETAVSNSIDKVNPQYRNELICWHARSIIDIISRVSEEEKWSIINWLKENQIVFDISDVREDIYLKQVLDSVFLDYKKLNVREKQITIVVPDETHIIEKIPEYFQIISQSKAKTCIEIQGKYITSLRMITREVIEEIQEVAEYCEVFSGRTDIFWIQSKNRGLSKIVDIGKEYKTLNPVEHFAIYTTEFYVNHHTSIDLFAYEGRYSAPMFQQSIAIIEGDFVGIENVILSQKEGMSHRKDILDLCSNIIRNSISICMGVLSCVQWWVAVFLKGLLETYGDESDYTAEEIDYTKKVVKKCLQNIDDEIIMHLPRITPEHKMFLINFKYGISAELRAKDSSCEFWQNQNMIYRQEDTYTMLEFCNYDGRNLMLEGRTICLNIKRDEKIIVFAKVNEVFYKAEVLPRECSRFWLGEVLFKGTEFLLTIPISQDVGVYRISFFYLYRGWKVARKDIRFGKYFPINREMKSSYYKKNDRVLTFENSMLEFRLCGRKGKFKREKAFLEEIKTKVSNAEYREIRKLRVAYFLYNIVKHKPIWLVSDKAHRADDNGEAFFTYLNQRKICHKVKSWFVYRRENEDYARMRKVGKVVEFNSFQHKLLSLLCQYQFGAYVHVSIVAPLFAYRDYFRDILCVPKIIFLQHGVTQNDLSSALNKYNQNFKAIITSNREETESFIQYKYHYPADVIKLLGLPRYDRLVSQPRKWITFAPTWRRYLFGEFVQTEERYVLKDDFRQSDFYCFYRDIFTSGRLREKLKEKGYELHFIPHPVFFPYVKEFKFEQDIIIHGAEVSYRKMYERSDLFITDYSSAVFDFAYMKKPVIYTQFDQKEFYDMQYEKGNFDYEKCGFGEVALTLDETINLIISYIDNGCQMKDKYRERVDSFFEYHDKKNSERIFNEFYKGNI